MYDIFVAKLDPTGAHVWSKDFGGYLFDEVTTIATDPVGNVYLYGHFRGQTDFGGGAIVGTPGATQEPFLAKLDANGSHQWSTFFPSVYAWANNMACGSGDVCVTGSFGLTIDFGGGVLTSAGNSDIYAARFSRFPLEPVIASIVDVGNDQGGNVWIDLLRAGHDGPSSAPIDHYEIFRKQEPAALTAATAAPHRFAMIGWDLAGSIPAHGEDDYIAIEPTLVDSTITEGQHYTTFFVRAVTGNPLVYFDSPPDSGYSLDNLAPGVPTNLVFQAGLLSWSGPIPADFDHYTVYGSSTNSFGSAVLINSTSNPSMDVSASTYSYYFVTATDVSGNESQAASLATPTAIGETPRSYVLSISASPNPFNPQTTIRYTLPSKGRVLVAVYDARGARVASLVDRAGEAGEYTQFWNGRNESGQTVSSGIYFARITNNSQTRTCKLVLLK